MLPHLFRIIQVRTVRGFKHFDKHRVWIYAVPVSEFHRPIVLHAHDNIAIAATEIAVGDALVMAAGVLSAPEAISIGHKLALMDMPKGTQILRYGAPIGSLTQAVKAGAHVHLHNLKSDYIATHDRETVTGDLI